MTTVRQSNFCCAIYEMGNLELPSEQASYWDDARHRWVGGARLTDSDIDRWWDREIREALESSREMGSNRALPRIIIFADARGEAGEEWAAQLADRGYKVEKFSLGRNPKSGNMVDMWHWHTTKARKRKAA